VENKFNLPNQERLSVVVATILLAFAITQFIKVPEGTEGISFGGILIPINFNLSTIITIAIASMTASGVDWILRDHPEIKDRSTIPHLLLPAITAWVQSVTLNNMADTPFKWGAFVVGGIFLLVVIMAEYIVIFPEDYRKPIAIALLTALIYAVILALSVSLVSTNQRLIILLPAVGLGAGILSMRVFQLQIQREWPLLPSLACLLVTSQLAAALHYLPITPLSYGLILLGALYFTINFTINLEQGVSQRRAAVEGIIPLLLIWLVALWIN
jgi:hypothetical protein